MIKSKDYNRKTTILIIDDDSSFRHEVRKFLREENFKILAAEDGEEGFEIYKSQKPQIIITDWLMPKLTGTELSEKIRECEFEQPVIIFLSAVSSIAAERMIYKSGGDYFLPKPLDKSKLIKLLNGISKSATESGENPTKLKESGKRKIPFAAVGIAASTGGPPTVKYLFSHLGKINSAAFFITQHGPEWMLKSSILLLQRETEMKVNLGSEGMEIRAGEIYIAPGERHMLIGEDLKIHLLDSAPINFVKPSADPMFKSIAEVFGKKSIGIVLTGMGSDGSIGCGYIHAEGGKIIVEDPATAILHAMPNAVIRIKLADVVASIESMIYEVKTHIDNIAII